MDIHAEFPGELVTRARTTKSRRAGALTEVEVPAPVRTLAGTHRAFRTASGCTVMVAREPARENRGPLALPESALLLWHLSIAHRHRYPGWDEIADVRYALVPEDVTMALLLPPPGEYVNRHEFTFHMWEIDDPRASDARSS